MATQNRYMLTPKKILSALLIIFSGITIPAAMAEVKQVTLSVCKYNTTVSATAKKIGGMRGVEKSYSGTYTFVCDNGVYKHINWGNTGHYNLKEVLKPSNNCPRRPKYEFHSETLGKLSWQGGGPGTISCKAMKIDKESLKQNLINSYKNYTLSNIQFSQQYPCYCATESTTYETKPLKKITPPMKKLTAPLKKLKRTKAMTCPQAIECKSSTEHLCTAKDSSNSTAKIAGWNGAQYHKKGTHLLVNVVLHKNGNLKCIYGNSSSDYVANYGMEPSNYSAEITLKLNKNFKGKENQWATWIECDQAKGADPKTCQVYAVD